MMLSGTDISWINLELELGIGVNVRVENTLGASKWVRKYHGDWIASGLLQSNFEVLGVKHGGFGSHVKCLVAGRVTKIPANVLYLVKRG